MILIDGGSTHNLNKGLVARKLSLPIVHTLAFQIFVGSGVSIECNAKSVDFLLRIQGHNFEVDTYVWDLKGAYVVLGVQ